MVKKEVDGVKKISYKAGAACRKLNAFFDGDDDCCCGSDVEN